MYPKTIALLTFALLANFPLTTTATTSLLGDHALSARRMLFGGKGPKVNHIPNGGTYYKLGNSPDKRDEGPESGLTDDNENSVSVDDVGSEAHSLEARARMPKSKPGLMRDPSGHWGIGNGRPKQKRDAESDHEVIDDEENDSQVCSLEARNFDIGKSRIMEPGELIRPGRPDRNRHLHEKKPFVHDIKEKRDETPDHEVIGTEDLLDEEENDHSLQARDTKPKVDVEPARTYSYPVKKIYDDYGLIQEEYSDGSKKNIHMVYDKEKHTPKEYFKLHPNEHPYVPKDKVEYLHSNKARFFRFEPKSPQNSYNHVKSGRDRFGHKNPHKLAIGQEIKEKRDEGLDYSNDDSNQFPDQDIIQTLETRDTVRKGRPIITYDLDGHPVAYAWPKSNHKRDEGLDFDPNGNEQFSENADGFDHENPVSGDADTDADADAAPLQADTEAKLNPMVKRGVEYDGTFADGEEGGKGYA